MTARRELWPDLVQQALFETDPVLRRERIAKAKKAIHYRRLELDTEKKMLRDAGKKLAAIE